MKFVFLFLNFLLLWTCAFTSAQPVSYFAILHNFYHSVGKCGEWHEICFSLPPLATIGTCAFAYAQLVSYFSILNNFYHSVKKCGEWHETYFSPSALATFVNLCICWCSGGKLLFNTSEVLSFCQKVWWHEICLSLPPLATIGNCAFTSAQPVSYFAILHNFYHSVKKCSEWQEICFSLSQFAIFVNLRIHFCSASKLLCNTS